MLPYCDVLKTIGYNPPTSSVVEAIYMLNHSISSMQSSLPTLLNLDPPKIGSPGTNFCEIIGPPEKFIPPWGSCPVKAQRLKSMHVRGREGAKVHVRSV